MYSQKISVIGVDPASISGLLLSYLSRSWDQLLHQKAVQCWKAFNKIISGFVTSVLCKVIAGKYVVRESVRHSQRVNDDPLVNTDLRHFRKRWDYFVSPLLGMQSWTGWLTYRACFILFNGNYTNSWKARLHAGKMLMDICRHMSMKCRMRELRTSIFHRLTTSGQRKARPENWGSTKAARIEPAAFIFISF